MPDVWATINELDTAMQERLVDVLETRAADPQQRAMRRTFLADIPFPMESNVLEVGCGTGALTRQLAEWENVGTIVGIDPASALIHEARKLAAQLPNVSFEEGDGRSLRFENEVFDVVVFDSTLSHVPSPELALAEAFRVLRRGGWLATFDGDYATTTVALGDHDPLQVVVDAMMANSVTDRYLMRRLRTLVGDRGFDVTGIRSHGIAETTDTQYMLTVVDRGADILHAAGQIDAEAGAVMKAEARRRVESGTFFGHVAYLSLIAQKPA